MIYNNWGDGMVKDPGTVWIGMEYFCNTKDDFWSQSDKVIEAIAIRELVKMDLARAEDVLDSTVRRMEKTYPAYFGTYQEFDKIKAFTDTIPNLFLIGRNGMHKYNNADHSMLTAMVAVDNIAAGITSKANIWAINIEQEYHEEKATVQETMPKSRHEKEPAYEGFRGYLSHDTWVRKALFLSGVMLIAQFFVFKLLYPFAGFIYADSYIYLQSATWNNSINIYPVGYSWFLRFISIFSRSDTFLVLVQYLMLEAASLFLIFSLFYLYKTGKVTRTILTGIVVLSPLFLYVANYVSSDAYFTSLSIVWFTLLIWIMRKPSARLVLLQALILFLAFATRYNALYYPVLTTIALLLTKQSAYKKLAYIAMSLVLIAGFIWNTSTKYKDLMGVRQFSPFSGWQLANNALYAYRYIDSADVKPVPPKFQKLDRMVRHYFDTTRDFIRHPTELLLANTFYMWDTTAPLQKYMTMEFKEDAMIDILKCWASEGPLYEAYGAYLIRTYPQTYIQFYLIPNALKCYAPPTEILSTYNMGKDSVAASAVEWFGYDTNKVSTKFRDNKVSALDAYPIAIGSLNLLFVAALVLFCLLKDFRTVVEFNRLLLIGSMLWLFNFGFSVIASPVGLRYQVFPFIICTSLLALFIEHTYVASKAAIPTQPVEGPLKRQPLVEVRS